MVLRIKTSDVSKTQWASGWITVFGKKFGCHQNSFILYIDLWDQTFVNFNNTSNEPFNCIFT